MIIWDTKLTEVNIGQMLMNRMEVKINYFIPFSNNGVTLKCIHTLW